VKTEAQARGGLFWVAAYEYTQARQWNLAPTLLDRAEDSDRELKPVALLLRAEVAAAGKNHVEAVYYLQSAVGEETHTRHAKIYHPANGRRTTARGPKQSGARGPEPGAG